MTYPEPHEVERMSALEVLGVIHQCVAEEREMCARLAEQAAIRLERSNHPAEGMALRATVAAIRARGQK